MHYLLHTAHLTPFTTHCKLYADYRTLHIAHYTPHYMHTAHYKLNIGHCKPHYMHTAPCTLHYTSVLRARSV